MFKFFNSLKETLTNYDKGILFEEFLKEFLDLNGYKILEWRPKYHSLEFDIIAQPNFDLKNEIVIEAKAHENKIDAKSLTSFIGKMVSFWDKKDSTLGLFLTLSDLTSEAHSYLRETKKSRNIEVISGDNMFNKEATRSKFLNFQQIKNKAKSITSMNPGDTYFCFTDRGYYYIQLLVPKSFTMPKYFIIFSQLGDEIYDTDFINITKSRVIELKNLKYFQKSGIITEFEENQKILIKILREGGDSLIEKGAGWFDYKLPAPPKYFIGRNNELKKFQDYLNNFKNGSTKISILQILSKSGVGKTSFILKSQSITDGEDNLSYLIDAREINNSLDLLDITQQIIKKFNNEFKTNYNIPFSLKECPNFFQESNSLLGDKNKFFIIYLDQFESIISKVAKNSQIFDFFYELANRYSCYYLVIARKSDYITNLDKMNFDIDKLRNAAFSIALPDFNKEEAIEMIYKLQEHFKKTIKPKLIQDILELSNGFPWLHKRICYHVYSLCKKGMTQDEILKSGLSLEELFKEEIEQLDEIDKDFLKKLVSQLPATLNNLDTIFEDDENFKKRIKKFKNLRLIRLTGNVLDTYNDFFKEYILRGTIPIIKRYILKISPNNLEKWFKIILKKNYTNIDSILSNESIKKGTVYNKLADMKVLGLIEYSQGIIKINSEARESLENSRFEEFLRQKLLDNELISGKNGILYSISEKAELTLEDIVEILKNKFLIVDRKEKTWKKYAKNIIKWLAYCNFGRELNFEISTNQFIKGRRKDEFYFEISVFKAIEIIEEFQNKEVIERDYFLKKAKRNEKALVDLRRNNLIDRGEKGYFLTNLGNQFLNGTLNERKAIVRQICFSWANINDFLVEIQKNPNKDLVEIFSEFISKKHWSRNTKELFFRKLKSWLVYSGEVIKSGHKFYHKNHTLERFL